MLTRIFVFLVCMLPITFIFLKTIIENDVYSKTKAIALWIVLYDLRIVFGTDIEVIELSVIDCVFITIGMIFGYIYAIVFIVKSKDTLGKLSIVFIVLYFIFVFSLVALEVQQIVMVYIFKAWLMITLLLALVALRNLPILWQIVGAIIVYILMLGINALISMQFLFALSENRFWEGIYTTIQRSYCLNAFNGNMSEIDVKTYIVDFFMCKIMDVILLGFCSARFLEIVGDSKAK